MNEADLSGAVWQKSSLSSGNGACVETAKLKDGSVAVRDTKANGAGPVLIFTEVEWQAFTGGVKLGEFD